MPRTGRPKKDPSERKAGFLNLRMSDAERELIDAAALKSSQKATTWAREALLSIASKMAST
jgi:uncharacterized protein (DUF1778 family)